MDSRIELIVDNLICYCNQRGLSDSCRSGNDPTIKVVLKKLGIKADSALAYLYQHIVGPFSNNGERQLPELLDVKSGVRNIASFSVELWENYSLPKTILAISEINTMTGLFYDTESDSVYQVEMDLEFPYFLNGEISPQWSNSAEFLVDFFGEEPIARI